MHTIVHSILVQYPNTTINVPQCSREHAYSINNTERISTIDGNTIAAVRHEAGYASTNEIEKSGQLFAKVKACLLRCKSESDNDLSVHCKLELDCIEDSCTAELTLETAFHIVLAVCSTEISSGSPPVFHVCTSYSYPVHLGAQRVMHLSSCVFVCV